MSKYKMEIELLSDLCVSDGGVYNSTVDIDVCYDEYGLPYIPAKRLKGCLREAALELVDWGDTSIDIRKIFGQAGKVSDGGCINITNAYLENYDSIEKEIEDAKGHPLYHPQNILSNFTYIRTQTSIDYETGIASENSLRTMRVVNKGLKFFATIDVKDEYEAVKKCVNTLTNIGMSRTRGLGEIKAKLLDDVIVDEKNETIDTLNHCNYLEYEIVLNEPIITLSAGGAEEKARDYIEGSSILGVVLSRLDSVQKNNLLGQLGNVVFSNAYISNSGIRYMEVPAYISSIKNNHTNYINNLYFDMKNIKGRQINPMKHTFVAMKDAVLSKIDVEMEERYHHRRSDDKSIGRAETKNTDNSNFYQIASINKNQVFKGFIYGDADAITTISNSIEANEKCRIGYGRSVEYGDATIKIKDKMLLDTEYLNEKTKRIVVKLNSPAIIYNDKAMYSVAIKDLISEVAIALGFDEKKVDLSKTRKYVNYTIVSGYNITWNKRKPVITAFDKGSAIDIVFTEEVNIKIPECLFLGERSTEGYGEAEVFIPEVDGVAEGTIENTTKAAWNKKSITISNDKLSGELVYGLLEDFIRDRAIALAREKSVNEKMRATVSNMILMTKEFDNMNRIRNAVKERYKSSAAGKNDKKKIAEGILQDVDNEIDRKAIMNQFETEFYINGCSYNAEELKLKFLNAYLRELKYRIRENKGRA